MEGDLNSVFVRLTEAARMGAEEYASTYADVLPQLIHFYEARPGSAAEVRANGIEDMSMAIKTSLLYNERVTLDVVHNNDAMTILGFTRKWFEERGVPESMKIAVPKAQANVVETAIKQRGIQFGFMMPSGDSVDQFLIDSAPLITQGRLIPRPGRRVLAMTEERTPEGGRVWTALGAAPGSSLDAWHVENEHHQLGKPTATESALAAQADAFPNLGSISSDIVLPYLSGVTLSDYSIIIQDEYDLMVEFRSAIKQLIEEYQKGTKSLDEFQKDVIDPRVAKINRTFEKISAMSKLRIGGSAVATVVLTLATYSTGGLAAAIAAVGGTAGLISTVKEAADRVEKLRSLKDDPLHLLWRLRQAQT